MIKITVAQVRGLKACSEGLSWLKGQKERRLTKVVKKLLEEGRYQWAIWLLPKLMTHPQKVMFAINAAKQVLSIFENKHPGDFRPRKAIEAAEDFLNGKIDVTVANAAAHAAHAAANADAANADAAYAAYAAAAHAAANAADAAYAAYVAYAAAYAAYAAAHAAHADAANADAAYVAYAAADAANAADVKCVIVNYGLFILGEEGVV